MIEGFKINIADFADGMALKDAIASQIAKSDIDMDMNSIGSLMDADIDLSGIIKMVAHLDSSLEIRQAVFKCLQRCTYNDEKITLNTFEPEGMRKHFYPVMWKCIKENLSPFLGGAFSALPGGLNLPEMLANLQNAQKSK